MYRVIVLSTGKDNNVKCGCRYTLSKRKVARFIVRLEECECVYVVEQFRKCGDLWYWSEDNIFNES